MRTGLLCYDDAYLIETPARVIAHSNGAVVLDQTVFFPEQPDIVGDTGIIVFNGNTFCVGHAKWADTERTHVAHVLTSRQPDIPTGAEVLVRVDWPSRYRKMRVHTALHLVAHALPFRIVGGLLRDGDGYKEFASVNSGMTSTELANVVAYLAGESLDVTESRMPQNDFANGYFPYLAFTSDRPQNEVVRAIQIGYLPPEMCSGLHVRNTREIGEFQITSIEVNVSNKWRVWLRVEDEVKAVRSTA